MGGMFSLSNTTMVICSKWLMTNHVNIILWAMLCLVGKDLYTGKSLLFCPRLKLKYAELARKNIYIRERSYTAHMMFKNFLSHSIVR